MGHKQSRLLEAHRHTRLIFLFFFFLFYFFLFLFFTDFFWGGRGENEVAFSDGDDDHVDDLFHGRGGRASGGVGGRAAGGQRASGGRRAVGGRRAAGRRRETGGARGTFEKYDPEGSETVGHLKGMPRHGVVQVRI